ncbi:MAG: hypothetical protein HQL32_12330 [Planctomycetes bacterium]|nr:hypothetical protein [Planctomycetota bacterium]
MSLVCGKNMKHFYQAQEAHIDDYGYLPKAGYWNKCPSKEFLKSTSVWMESDKGISMYLALGTYYDWGIELNGSNKMITEAKMVRQEMVCPATEGGRPEKTHRHLNINDRDMDDVFRNVTGPFSYYINGYPYSNDSGLMYEGDVKLLNNPSMTLMMTDYEDEHPKRVREEKQYILDRGNGKKGHTLMDVLLKEKGWKDDDKLGLEKERHGSIFRNSLIFFDGHLSLGGESDFDKAYLTEE